MALFFLLVCCWIVYVKFVLWFCLCWLLNLVCCGCVVSFVIKLIVNWEWCSIVLLCNLVVVMLCCVVLWLRCLSVIWCWFLMVCVCGVRLMGRLRWSWFGCCICRW